MPYYLRFGLVCLYVCADEVDVGHSYISSLAPMLPLTRRRLSRRLHQAHMPAPEAWLQHLQAYVAGAIHYTLQALMERGVSMPDGSPSPTFVFSSSASSSTSASSTRKTIPIASKTSPVNGVGTTSTAFDANLDDDTNLLIYLVNPFTQVRFYV